MDGLAPSIQSHKGGLKNSGNPTEAILGWPAEQVALWPPSINHSQKSSLPAFLVSSVWPKHVTVPDTLAESAPACWVSRWMRTLLEEGSYPSAACLL